MPVSKRTFIALAAALLLCASSDPFTSGRKRSLGHRGEISIRTIAPALDGNGQVYVGGKFQAYRKEKTGSLVRINDDGTLDLNFITGTGFNETVNAVAVDSSTSKVYAGGSFDVFNDLPVTHLVRLNQDGTLDTSFQTGSGLDGEVNAILPLTDGSGKLYIAGSFTVYNGQAAKGIARLKSDGTFDSSFAVEGFTNNGSAAFLKAIVFASDGSHDLYCGGSFSSYGSTARQNLARLKPDGTLDSKFDTTIATDSSIHALATGPGNSLYAGGYFYYYQGNYRPNLVRVSRDGSLDTTLTYGYVYSTVTALANRIGDNLLIGGYFDYYYANGNYNYSRGFLSLTSSLDIDTSFNRGLGFDSYLQTIATDGSGGFFVGGTFTRYDGLPAKYIVRLNSDGTINVNFHTAETFTE